jgi:hypothetical protein
MSWAHRRHTMLIDINPVAPLRYVRNNAGFCRDRRDDPMTRSGRQRRDRADKPFNPSAARCFYRLA